MITIVSHDAGGAELLSSYVLQNPDSYEYILEGPALKIFNQKLNGVPLTTLENAKSNTRLFLCSTSWQSDIEWNAFRLAKSHSIKSIAFLDHWTNFEERFVRYGEICLPDEIWVADDEAKKIAESCFPYTQIFLKSNPYLLEMQRKIQLLESGKQTKDGDNILFVCENITDHSLKFGNLNKLDNYSEFDALEFFFDKLDKISKSINKIIIRPHPSDLEGKYNYLLDLKIPNLVISVNRTLLEDISDSDIVVGCESMAMVVGLIANKTVVSCIPPGGKRRSLPFPKILDLQLL